MSLEKKFTDEFLREAFNGCINNKTEIFREEK